MSEETQQKGFYKPLAKTGEIRLLYIESLEECAPNDYKLWCSIKHIKLSEKFPDDAELNERTRYEALSYEWGSEENPQDIWIRGHPAPILIRENLYIALVALLLPDSWRPLWVDAICINQDDVEERNSQVTQMATIYSSADLVVVWLGKEAFDSSRAMKLLEQVETALDTRKARRLLRETSDITRFITKKNFKSIMALKALCLRTYWNRLWIIQEVSKAQAVVLQCGLDVVPWEKFVTVCNIANTVLSAGLASTGELPVSVSSALRNIKESRAAQLISLREDTREINAVDSRSSAQEQKRLETHDILSVFEKNFDADCRNPHDMIFGLLSITLPCCQRSIQVDYGMPVDALCHKVLEHHMKKHCFLSKSGELLKRSQLLHKRLKASPLTFSKLPPAPNRLKLLRFRCTPGKHIQYLSQQSSDLLRSPQSQFSLTDEPNGWMNLEISSERDLVCSSSQAYSKCKRSLSKSQLHGYNYLLPRAQEQVDREEEIQNSLVQLLDKAKREDPDPANSSCRIAVDREGEVYFVPADTELGDVILQFMVGEGSSVLAVVRETSDRGCFIAGRAVSFFRNLPSVTGSTSGTTGKFLIRPDSSFYNVMEWEVNHPFNMDPYAIQLLTRSSSFSMDKK
ncbi:HET-domain-containing protein [Stipitochalara longipes BDJ]|nr:HET-domain-containing protein [Stipitochalara longipes BDJ]